MADLEEKLAARRREMVRRDLAGRGIRSRRVLDAFAEVPRERFLPPDCRRDAYADYPTPIGCGQTISQPYVVALMVEALDPRPDHRVLDVGAGSGYQTAILARLVRHVYAVERIDELAQAAAGVLAELNVANVTLRTADGTLGWPEEAPFDGIICGAAAPDVPGPWIEQLADGGRIVVPVGGPGCQTVVVLHRLGCEIRRGELGDVRFVKLIGREGWSE